MPRPDTRSAAFPGGRLFPATAISPWGGAGTSSSPGCFSSTAWLISSGASAAGISAAISRPSANELKHIGASIAEHARLKFPKGEEAKHYNVLQKLTYLFVALILLPLMLLTGLAMSPGMDAAFPILLDVLGGRQTARTIHFISASFIVIFVVVHLIMVLISGVWNNLRSMITGRYVIEPAEEKP